ncbi:hypothetical protein M8J76_015751 [Diaphorina citri]|nr:hypothetical protein M8J76_015751 [Diaphorina citri]KAI5724411.1 hypothetical protein M8J77_002272 [Diaphorina citri]
MLYSQKGFGGSLSIHKLIVEWLIYNPGASNTTDAYDSFIRFCNTAMQSFSIAECLKKTQGQTSSPLWHDLRYGRVTASKIYEASRWLPRDLVLVSQILGAQKVKNNHAMERGRMLEPLVCAELEKVKKKNHVGLALNREYPIFGASPDGVMGDSVLEIKCPISEETFKKYFDSTMKKPSAKYAVQIMLQMLFFNKVKGLFVVAQPDFKETKNMKILEVHYDYHFMDNVLKRANNFWRESRYFSNHKN